MPEINPFEEVDEAIEGGKGRRGAGQRRKCSFVSL